MEQIQLNQQEKISLGTKEISKRIRDQLKKEFSGCKFSVVMKSYSGGSNISINLMEGDIKVIRDFKDISESALFDYGSRSYSEEQIREVQETKHHQLNQYTSNEDFNEDVWNNGVFLTKQGYELFKRVVEIINQYNYDNSDSQTDYSDVNFYVHLSIGKWNKDYKEAKK